MPFGAPTAIRSVTWLITRRSTTSRTTPTTRMTMTCSGQPLNHSQNDLPAWPTASLVCSSTPSLVDGSGDGVVAYHRFMAVGEISTRATVAPEVGLVNRPRDPRPTRPEGRRHRPCSVRAVPRRCGSGRIVP